MRGIPYGGGRSAGFKPSRRARCQTGVPRTHPHMPVVLTALALAVALQQPAQTIAAAPSRGGPAPAAARRAASVPARAAASAVRVTVAPVIDGRLEDAAWAGAPPIADFREYDPREDGEPRFRTETRVAYDAKNLYVSVRSFDPHPDSIVARLGRRDASTASDRVLVYVDGYHDKRTGFGFLLNAAGVKGDVSLVNDTNEDDSWDAVWEGAARIDSLGWVAEFRIPLNQIRYPAAGTHTFGMLVMRDIARHNERVSWPLLRKSRPGVASQFGELAGIADISSSRHAELSPYTVARTTNVPRGARYGQLSQATVGADLKVGLTSSLTLDATVNPDFGQVEADPSVLNLSAFESFFQEKRPFFVEGRGLFSFDLDCNDGNCSGLFYSRRIGRSPQLGGVYEDRSNPTATTILGAAKLTGQLGRGMSVGVLDAVTQREVSPRGETIEPGANYFVGRVQQDLRDGQTNIGVMGTSVRRQVDPWSEDRLRADARALGVNFRHQFLDRRYSVSGYLVGSRVAGTAEAIAQTQRGLVHNYLRPDDALVYDSTRTSLSGISSQLVLSKDAGKSTRWSVVAQRVTPGFEVNDVGYLGRANIQSQSGWFQYRDDTPNRAWRALRVNVNQWSQYDASGMLMELGGNVNGHVQLPSKWWVHAGTTRSGIGRPLCDLCSRGGPAVAQSPSQNAWAGVDGNSQRSVVPSLWTRYSTGDEGRSHGWGLDPSVRFRVSSRWDFGTGLSYGHDVNDAQWYGKYDGAAGTNYTFARLDQTTLSLTTRLNFTATPALSLEVYASPFITSGHYSDWRALDDPRAARYAARYRPFATPGESLEDFNFKQLRTNAVLRWEYRPGSVLFLVWGQERMEDQLDPGSFRVGRDYRSLFGTRPSNTLLIKGSYWLSL